jgi:hypothetical protein
MDTVADLIDLRDQVALTGNAAETPAQAATSSTNDGTTTPATAQMDLDSISGPDLGNMYNQCKLARESALTTNFTYFGSDSTFNTGSAKTARIGNLNMTGDNEVEHTFHGVRICKGSKVVNECISVSFDPRNMMCIGCKNNHKIGDSGPLTICFADQNMVPFITDGKGGCIAIVRLENSSLADLVDLSFEILEKSPPPQAA